MTQGAPAEKAKAFVRASRKGSRRNWFVYVVECANGAFYTGITCDVVRRMEQHNSGRGAKYTRAFGPVKLVWLERSRGGQSAALKREALVRRLPRAQKARLIGR